MWNENKVSIGDFKKIDIRIGKIVEVTEHPDATRLLVLKVDIGSGVCQVVAGIKNSYAPESLIGKSVVVVCNLQVANIRGIDSEAMLLATKTDKEIILLVPDKEAPQGSVVS